MSTIKANAVLDSAGGTTATINGYTPSVSNMAGRNRIINGGCAVAQRAAVTLTNSPQYGQCDRHIGYISAGTGISGTISQNPNSLFVGGNAFWLASASYTSGTWAYQQRIESVNCQDLNGQTVTVQFKIAHDFGSARTVTVSLAKANSKDNFGSVTAIGSAYVSAAIPSTTSSVTTVTCSFTLGATDATNGILLQINDSSATTVSAKNVLIGDIQLEKGSASTPFDFRPYGTELALCQRYYATSTSFYSGPSVSGTPQYAGSWLSVPMRATPTLSGNSFINNGFPATTGTLTATNSQFFYESRSGNSTLSGGAVFGSGVAASAEL